MLVELLAMGLAFGLGLAVQSARQQGRHDEDFARLFELRAALLDEARELLRLSLRHSPPWQRVLAVHDRLLLEHGIQPGPAEDPS